MIGKANAELKWKDAKYAPYFIITWQITRRCVRLATLVSNSHFRIARRKSRRSIVRVMTAGRSFNWSRFHVIAERALGLQYLWYRIDRAEFLSFTIAGGYSVLWWIIRRRDVKHFLLAQSVNRIKKKPPGDKIFIYRNNIFTNSTNFLLYFLI